MVCRNNYFFWAASCFFIQYGIQQYKSILKEKNNFQACEEGKLKKFVFVTQYSDYGLRLCFMPSPMMAFFDSGPIPDHLNAFIDTSERMKIYQPLKGQNPFVRFAGGFLNLTGFLLFLALYWFYFMVF